LGDSRIDGLNTNEIQRISGEKYSNLAYGGGTAYEIIDTFWFATKRTSLKKVYIGINFNLFSSNNKGNRVPETISLIQFPLRYYLNLYITKISFYHLASKLWGINLVSESQNMEKAAFWNKQLGITTEAFYKVYSWPDAIIKELNRIKDYCKENNIELYFIIPPTHADLQNKVLYYSLSKEYGQYKQVLADISETIDFDYPNEWTKNKESFSDPYHIKEALKLEMVKEIFGKDQMRIGHILKAKK